MAILPFVRCLNNFSIRDLGGNVTERLYPNMGHSVNQDEITFVRGMMELLVAT